MKDYSLSSIRVALELLDEYFHEELMEALKYAIVKDVKGWPDPYSDLKKLVLEKGTSLKRYELDKERSRIAGENA